MENNDIQNVPNELMSLAMKDVNCKDNITVIVIRIK
jgi:serine/threonine protein phosphatase PrpC